MGEVYVGVVVVVVGAAGDVVYGGVEVVVLQG